jgi:hypothetical protein
MINYSECNYIKYLFSMSVKIFKKILKALKLNTIRIENHQLKDWFFDQ